MRGHISAALARIERGEQDRFVVPVSGARNGDRKAGARARAEEKRARRAARHAGPSPQV